MTKRALVLVEGQTEERFIKDVLAPAFLEKDLYLYPTILVTKVVKDGANFKGGVSKFAKFRDDAARLLGSAGGALVTTLLDYYALPADFPGMADRPAGTNLQRIKHVETEVHKAFGAPKLFLPFLALHEFEAWIFSSPNVLPQVMTSPAQQPAFATIRAGVKTPEDINERPTHAPSKRIRDLFPAFKKPLHGPLAIQRIGLQAIRDQCPHFAEWLTKLEHFATS